MKLQDTHLFIDFDSTFNQVESLDTLIEITITDESKRKEVLEEIVEITNLGMAGKLDYMESLRRRIKLLKATKADVHSLSKELYKTISKSIAEHQDFFVQNKEFIYIISNGFKDFIVPVAEQFGLNPNQVFANEFVYNTQDEIIGVNTENPLARTGGKPKVIRNLQLTGTIVMIGDGYNDYQVKKADECDSFILFTENVTRKDVLPLADHIAPTFHDVLKLIQND